jgi:hypothetical protein
MKTDIIICRKTDHTVQKKPLYEHRPLILWKSALQFSDYGGQDVAVCCVNTVPDAHVDRANNKVFHCIKMYLESVVQRKAC